MRLGFDQVDGLLISEEDEDALLHHILKDEVLVVVTHRVDV